MSVDASQVEIEESEDCNEIVVNCSQKDVTWRFRTNMVSGDNGLREQILVVLNSGDVSLKIPLEKGTARELSSVLEEFP